MKFKTTSTLFLVRQDSQKVNNQQAQYYIVQQHFYQKSMNNIINEMHHGFLLMLCNYKYKINIPQVNIFDDYENLNRSVYKIYKYYKTYKKQGH